MDFSAAFQRIQNSVVNVLALDGQSNAVSSGSGTIVIDFHHIVTCAHCVIPNMTMIARFSGQNQGAICSVVFIDQDSDIAILRAFNPLGAPVQVTCSSGVQIGHEGFVVGFPNNIQQITALSANIAGFENDAGVDYLRLDSSVNHGNSGGPLFNAHGHLIGVVNAKHGSLSNFLRSVKQARPGASINVGGIDPVKAIQQLIHEMEANLNLGIGYAIPTLHIGNLYPLFRAAIS